ncbi:MAG TPA: hypothetical protein VIM58_02590 [Candidatus Methylacidiphilales bacterium]
MKATLKHLRPLGFGLLAFAAAALAPSVRAQSTPPPAPPAPPADGAPAPHHGMDPAKQLERMKKDLGLSDDQVAKLKPIFADQFAAMKSIHENTSLSDEEKHTQAKAAREAAMEKIKAILTPDQLEKYKAMHHHGPGGPGGPEGAAPSASTPSAK